MPGLSYIGLEKEDIGNGNARIVPYQKNNIVKTNLPNIPVQFRYHANKTINSWNSFI
jgi:hypothetical protein